MRFTCVSICCVSSLFAAAVHAETVQCPDIKDTWLSSCDKECDANMGKAPKIKLKGYQEYGLLDFDVSALKGKKIISATLFISPVGEPKFGKERGSELRWFSISTVSSDWKEGDGTNYTIDSDGEGATFNEASFMKTPWSYPGSHNWDVILGNGNTIRTDVDGGDPKDGWFAIPVDVRIVEALVNKASYGMLLMDGSVFAASNPFISSREGAKPPYLKVEVEAAPAAAPAPKAPADLAAVAAPNSASMDSGAIALTFTVPENAFSYDILVDGKPVPRWQIPFAAKAGSKQTFPIATLPAGQDVKLDFTAVDAAGNKSEVASINLKTSPAITVPKLPAPGWLPKGGSVPKIGDKLSVWAFPEISKLDPQTGEIVQEKNMDTAKFRNSVWDAGAQTIRIPAARGEIAAFQVALEANHVVDVNWKIEGLDGIKVKAFRTWFVKVQNQWQADYAIPLKDGEAVAIPAGDNKILNQKAAVLAVDLIVPETATAGDKTGTLTVSTEGGEVKLKIELVVYDAVIPSETHFIPELNIYGGPFGPAGSQIFYDAFRLAHYYRCTLNRVPHHHNGKTDEDWIPQTGPDGHVTDWADYDKNLGPLLDGSAFKDNPRANVPVPLLYLPFNESYPQSIKAHYKPGDNVPLSGKDWKELHDMLAKSPEQSFDQEYKDAFVNCVQDFVKHYEEKRWTHTIMEGFHNNKFQYGSVMADVNGKQEKVPGMTGTAWTLDEPQQWLDWQALLFYSKLFHKGIAGKKTVNFGFRGDISRPMWQGACMDGYMEVMVGGGAQFSMLPLMKDFVRRTGMKLFDYGGCNGQDRANHNTTAWVLKSYAHGCDGVLPWQSIGGEEALEKGDFIGPKGGADNGNMLIVESHRFGGDVVASFRLQAFRSGAQIAELLRLLEQKKGWSHDFSAALVSQLLPLGAQFKQSNADDAGALKFDDANGDVFVQLKEGILKLLAEK
jgi:hypothetical protein